MTPLPAWLDPLFEAAEMRAADAWAIEEQHVPSLDLMERAGAGLARVAAAAARRRAGARGGGQGQQRRRRPGGGPAAARGRPRGGRCWPRRRSRSCAATRWPTWSGCPEPAGAVRGGAPGRLRRGGRRPSGHRASRARPASRLRAAIAAINEQDAPVVACDVPSGVNASTRRGRGRGRACAGDGHLPRLEAGAARGARQVPRGAGGGGGDRHPARRAGGARRPA